MFIFVLLSVCLYSVSGQSSTTPRPEQEVRGSIRFYYEPQFHTFTAQTTSTCFMAQLTKEEKDHVHSNNGNDDMQLRMLREWIGQLPETKIYHSDPNLPPYVAHVCERQDIYLLERHLTGGDFTTNSPLSGIIG